MEEVLQSNQTVFRGCILYQVLLKKPVFDAYKIMYKAMGNYTIDYVEFEYWYYKFYQGNHDLDYDRSLDPKCRSFSDLPTEIIEKIAERLDITSRIDRLIVRKVSKNMRIIIDYAKVEYNFINIEIQGDLVNLKFNEHLISYMKDDDGCMVTHENRKKKIHDVDFLEIAFNDLVIELKNPNLRVKQMTVIFTNSSINMSEKCVKHFETISNSMSSPFHVKNLLITSCQISEVLPILSCLKAGTLEQIELRSSNERKKTKKKIGQIVEMDQWKQAKRVIISEYGVISSVYLDCFFHFTHFKAFFKSISRDDTVRLRSAISKSANFEYCHLEVLDRAIVSSAPQFQQKVFRLSIPDSNEVLEYKIDLFNIKIKRKH